jgi:aspartate dehydrogenase
MTMRDLKRVGLVGYGTIGSYLAQAVVDRQFAQLDFVYDANPQRTQLIPAGTVLEDPSQIRNRNVDLVVETATQEAVHALAPGILEETDLLIFSVTSLADDVFRESVREICKKHSTRLYVPHGAILGLDGIFDGRAVLREVTITTTKHPRNLGLDETASGILYDGPTRGACQLFPRNVNVHAALAVVGLGFDRTRSVVIADPDTNQMRHDIEARGEGLEWNLRIASRPVGAVTGSYTPESAAMTVRRTLAADYDITLA